MKVLNVAQYILEEIGKMTTMKLQKLVYYSQAWFLVWNDKPLFESKIEAWLNGPMVRDLYEKHKGMFEISKKLKIGDSSNLTEEEKGDIDKVLKVYGDKDGDWLSCLTHSEYPWQNARKGVPENEHSENEITHKIMKRYYSSL